MNQQHQHHISIILVIFLLVSQIQGEEIYSHTDFGHEIIYSTHGVDPASVGFEPVPYGTSFENVKLSWRGKNPVPDFLNGTFYRGAPGQWPDGYWLDGLITLNAFAFRNGKIHYTMQYNKDDAYNASFSGRHLKNTNGTLPHFPNSSFPTGVSFRRVGDHLLTNTGVTNSNEVDPHTLGPVSMPFTYDDDLGAPYVGPTHAQIVDDVVLHHFVRHVQDNDGKQTYVVTSIEPRSTKRQVLTSIESPKASSWQGKASFQHMTLATSDYYIMLESSCYYPTNVTRYFCSRKCYNTSCSETAIAAKLENQETKMIDNLKDNVDATSFDEDDLTIPPGLCSRDSVADDFDMDDEDVEDFNCTMERINSK